MRPGRPHHRTHISNRARLPGFPGCQARACRLRRSANHRGRRRRDEDSGRALLYRNIASERGEQNGGFAEAKPPGKGVPGMKATWLARKLGLDGNPLRRRTDKIAAWAAALLLAVFLIGAPLLSVAAIGWAGRAGAAGQRAGAPGIRFPPSCCRPRRRPPSAEESWAIPGSRPGGPRRTAGLGPVRSRSALAWPLAARSRCGWTRRARRPVRRPATGRWLPARPPRRSLPLSRWGSCCCAWRGPGGGA